MRFNLRLLGQSSLIAASLGLLGFASPAHAALLYSTDFNTFNGGGFAPGAPVTGQIDSNYWIVTAPFGGDSMAWSDSKTNQTTDFARGQFSNSSPGSSAGVYAAILSVTPADHALAVRPYYSSTASYQTVFQPGGFVLRIPVAPGLTSYTVDYDTLVFNDKNNSNTFTFSYSTDNSAYTTLSAETVTSPTTADTSPSWGYDASHDVTLSNIDSTSGYLYLQWRITNSGGSSAYYDGMALDNVVVNSISIPEPATLAVLAMGSLALIRRR